MTVRKPREWIVTSADVHTDIQRRGSQHIDGRPEGLAGVSKNLKRNSSKVMEASGQTPQASPGAEALGLGVARAWRACRASHGQSREKKALLLSLRLLSTNFLARRAGRVPSIKSPIREQPVRDLRLVQVQWRLSSQRSVLVPSLGWATDPAAPPKTGRGQCIKVVISGQGPL